MTRTYTVKQEYLVKILEYFLFLHKTCPRRGFSYGRVEKIILKLLNTQPALVAQSDSHQEIQGFDTPVLATLGLIMKYFFTVILSLLLIQEGHLSVSGKRMCTSTD